MNVLECSAKVLRYFGEVQRGVCSRAKFNFILCYFFYHCSYLFYCELHQILVPSCKLISLFRMACLLFPGGVVWRCTCVSSVSER